MNEYMKEAERLLDEYKYAAGMVAEPADDAVRLTPYGRNCQNGGDVCLASRADGIVCSDDSCDIDTGIRATPAPAEVPMPQGYAERPSDYTGDIWIESQMRTYGVACRAAGEAAGYIKGVKEENKRCKQILIEKMKYYDTFPNRALEAQSFDHAQILLGGWAYEAALRGEVKP